VQLSRQPGVLLKDVAGPLCVHPFMLSLWRHQVYDGELSGATPGIDVVAVAIRFDTDETR
jgi:transposase